MTDALYNVLFSYAMFILENEPANEKLKEARAELTDLLESNREQAEAISTLRAERDELRRESEQFADAFNLECAKNIELRRQLAQAQRELNHYHHLQADIDMGVITLEMPREDES